MRDPSLTQIVALVAFAATYLGLANLIVVEAARGARIELRFLEYCRVGVPLTLTTLLVGWATLSLLPAP